MDEAYKYYLNRYLELDKNTTLSRPYMTMLDAKGLLKNIEDIEINLYPHKVIHISNNILFRAEYENIKHHSDGRFILVIENRELKSKLLDFISKGENSRCIEFTMLDVLNLVENGQNWNVRINEYNTTDISNIFSRLIAYRKRYVKRNILREETDKVVLSAVYDIDATSINDAADCYIYYKNLISTYSTLWFGEYKTNLKALLCDVFRNNGGKIISQFIENSEFDIFEKLTWLCCALNRVGKLNYSNIKSILKEEYESIKNLEPYFKELAALGNIVEKKNKKLYIEMIDKADSTISQSSIVLYSSGEDYISFVMENRSSISCVIEGTKKILKDFNIEGLKKIYRYKSKDLILIQETVNAIPEITENITNIREYLNILVDIITNIEDLETCVISSFEHTEWTEVYKRRLSKLQYNVAKIKYIDKYSLLEEIRYKGLEDRVSSLLNKFRKAFGSYLNSNYSKWTGSDYSIERPVLNSDISGFMDFKANKIFIIIFDGMRLDAWEEIVKGYFSSAFKTRDVNERNAFALLPSITAISRTAIYHDIQKNYKNDSGFMTKTESIKKQEELKDLLVQDKKINIIIYNMFDRDGHKAVEDFYLFYDKQNKVFEKSIKSLVESIPEDADIIICSDHGQMRIDEHINLKEQLGISDIKSRYVTLENTDKEVDVIDCYKFGTNLLGYSNKGYFRGGGEKDLYSHGGCSIEEVIVPYIYAKSGLIKKNGIINEVTEGVTYNIGDTVALHDGKLLKVPVDLNEKEKFILSCLYKHAPSSLTTRDIEKLLINKFGNAGMIDGIIKRLLRKMNKQSVNIIDVAAAGDVFVYKLLLKNLEGGILVE